MIGSITMRVFIMGCLQLDNTACVPVLKEKEKTLKLLYINYIALNNITVQKHVLMIKYEGVNRMIPSSVNMLFSPAFAGGVKSLNPEQIKKISKKKFKECLNDKQIDDVYFIFDFLDYMSEKVDSYNNKLYPIIMKYIGLLKDCNSHENGTVSKYVINASCPFINVGRLSRDVKTQQILEEDIPKLEKLEKKFHRIESKIITELDVVSVLGVIPKE